MTPSSPVTSRQTGPHPRLDETVLKHVREPWRKPVADHTREAFGAIASRFEAWSGPRFLDTGCGTGLSTVRLAAAHPEALVIGVDKSADRLERTAAEPPPNALLVRADLEDFWLLAKAAGWRFDRQQFFYPNPWPKPEHRSRRWAFHPVFPVALACGGVWELRTNWLIYAQEFSRAFALLTGVTVEPQAWNPADPDTLFEKKYQASGHALWRWEGTCPALSASGAGPGPLPPPG